MLNRNEFDKSFKRSETFTYVIFTIAILIILGYFLFWGFVAVKAVEVVKDASPQTIGTMVGEYLKAVDDARAPKEKN